MSWLINLVPYHGLWQQVMVHYVKQTKRPFQLSWRNFLHLRSVCQTTLHVSLTQWALFKSKNVVKRSFQKWSSRSSAVSFSCQKIDFIFDGYRDKSIKNVERFDARGAALATAFKSILGKSLAVFYQRIKVQDGVYLFHVQRAEEAVLQIKISE